MLTAPSSQTFILRTAWTASAKHQADHALQAALIKAYKGIVSEDVMKEIVLRAKMAVWPDFAAQRAMQPRRTGRARVEPKHRDSETTNQNEPTNADKDEDFDRDSSDIEEIETMA